MKAIGSILLLGGLLVAVLTGLFWPANPWIPWVAAVCGLGVGVFNIGGREPGVPTVIGLIGLVLALYVIEQQWYNPEWLTHVVFYLRVFVSHALLGVGTLVFLRVAVPKG